MGLKVTGLGGTLAIKLSNMARRASEGARNAMDRGARDIRDQARLYAPVDEGNLEDAIRIRTVRDGIRGRYTFDIYVDEDQSAKGNRTVGNYAERMHEGDYELGVLSNAKAEELGIRVGPKFLERALDDLEDKIYDDVKTNINKRIGK